MAAESLPAGGLVVTRTDTTVHHGVNEVLAELAFHDDLTGLPNRGLVLDRIRMALIRAQRLGLQPLIVFTDLDGFKEVNDRYGHEVGRRGAGRGGAPPGRCGPGGATPADGGEATSSCWSSSWAPGPRPTR